MPVRFLNNDWASVSGYSQLDADNGTAQFTACNIVYSLTAGITSLGENVFTLLIGQSPLDG